MFHQKNTNKILSLKNLNSGYGVTKTLISRFKNTTLSAIKNKNKRKLNTCFSLIKQHCNYNSNGDFYEYIKVKKINRAFFKKKTIRHYNALKRLALISKYNLWSYTKQNLIENAHNGTYIYFLSAYIKLQQKRNLFTLKDKSILGHKFTLLGHKFTPCRYNKKIISKKKMYDFLLFSKSNKSKSLLFCEQSKISIIKTKKYLTFTKFPIVFKKSNFLLFKFFYVFNKTNFLQNPNDYISPFFFSVKNKVSPFALKKKTFVSQREHSYSCISFYMEKKSVFYKNSYFFGIYLKGMYPCRQINNRIFKLFTYKFDKTPYTIPQSKLFLELDK